MQAVTKYTVTTRGLSPLHTHSESPCKHEINIRDAFVAAPGCVLIAADYSQIELRVLAHLSGDARLMDILRQAGVSGDAFALIAKTWLRQPNASGRWLKCCSIGNIYMLSKFHV